MYDDKSNFEASDLFSRYDIGDGLNQYRYLHRSRFPYICIMFKIKTLDSISDVRIGQPNKMLYM